MGAGRRLRYCIDSLELDRVRALYELKPVSELTKKEREHEAIDAEEGEDEEDTRDEEDEEDEDDVWDASIFTRASLDWAADVQRNKAKASMQQQKSSTGWNKRPVQPTVGTDEVKAVKRKQARTGGDVCSAGESG